MRIRNEGKRTFFFNGGKIAPGEVVDIRDEAVAKALLRAYPKELISLDDLEVTVVESQENAGNEGEEAKAPAPKKTSKKSKKA